MLKVFIVIAILHTIFPTSSTSPKYSEKTKNELKVRECSITLLNEFRRFIKDCRRVVKGKVDEEFAFTETFCSSKKEIMVMNAMCIRKSHPSSISELSKQLENSEKCATGMIKKKGNKKCTRNRKHYGKKFKKNGTESSMEHKNPSRPANKNKIKECFKFTKRQFFDFLNDCNQILMNGVQDIIVADVECMSHKEIIMIELNCVRRDL